MLCTSLLMRHQADIRSLTGEYIIVSLEDRHVGIVVNVCITITRVTKC